MRSEWCCALAVAAGWHASAGAQTSFKTYFGANPGENFGRSVAAAGDVDGDGFADLLCGAPTADTQGKIDNGVARILSGRTGLPLLTLNGAASFDMFGLALAGAGDVDGDGHGDVIVAAAGADLGGDLAGSAAVFSGANGALLTIVSGALPDEQLGQAVAGVGDLDNDGFPDCAAGAWTASIFYNANGYVRAFRGKDGTPIFTAIGDSTGAGLGSALDAAGDVNADGFDDVVAGAYRGGTNFQGVVRVFGGPTGTTLLAVLGDAFEDHFGTAVAGAGDVDDDGRADLLIGANLYDTVAGQSAGLARVVAGKTGATIFQWFGLPGDRLGSSVAAGSDVTGDGRPDFIAGAPRADANGIDSGAALIFSGVSGAGVYAHLGDSPDDNFGIAVADTGDATGDLRGDVLVGAFKDDDTGGDAGSARLFYDPCLGTVALVGSGCPGSGGYVPELRLLGCPGVGREVELTIEKGLGGATALLLFGLGPADISAGLCHLYLAPLLPALFAVPLGGAGAGAGSFNYPAVIPAVPTPVSFAAQVLVLDPGAASFKGISATNGIAVTVQ